MFVCTIPYKPLAGISLNSQLQCSWRQRWTDYIWGQKVKA